MRAVAGTPSLARTAALAAALAVGALVLYLPTTRHGFIDLDDPQYVVNNPMVAGGLTREGVRWAFTTFRASNWHPLTWLSHMADVSVFGLHPAGHHLVNVLLHSANAALLFWLLAAMTGAAWPSATVAALFASHPLHVESVAWVAERKDLLSTLLLLLAMAAYLRYARRPAAGRLLTVAGLCAAGLAAKPMLVTAPFLLLVLDWWPLGRLRRPRALGRLAAEKWPLLVLALGSSVVTYQAQKSGAAVTALLDMPFRLRLGNALVSYAGYFRKAFWPSPLAAFYPHPGPTLAMWKVGVSTLFLAAATAAVLAVARRRPYLAAGWFWYVGTLVPVIGLVQVGGQAMADRYTYFPLVGVFLGLVWTGAGLRLPGKPWRAARAALALGAVAASLALSARQVAYWRDTRTLMSRALSVTEGNWLALNILGVYLAKEGRLEEAAEYYRRSMAIYPAYADAHYNLGLALRKRGRLYEALAEFAEAIRLNPRDADSHFNVSLVLAEIGREGEAMKHYLEASRLDPGFLGVRDKLTVALVIGRNRLRPGRGPADLPSPGAEGQDWGRRSGARLHNNLGLTLVAEGRRAEAAEHFREAVRLDPGLAEAAYNLAVALDALGRQEEARQHLQAALSLEPDFPEAHNNLGIILAREGSLAEAVTHFREALRLKPDFAEARDNLQMALAGEDR